LPHSTDWEPKGIVWTFWGVVTGEELLSSNHEIYGDPRFDALHYQIVDLTGVEQFVVSEDDMIILAATDRAAALSNGSMRVAVAAVDGAIRELSRLYAEASGGSPWRQEMFDTVAEAREWVASNSEQ
jgi:hypothetical protein